jgi:hypothetical protein
MRHVLIFICTVILGLVIFFTAVVAFYSFVIPLAERWQSEFTRYLNGVKP